MAEPRLNPAFHAAHFRSPRALKDLPATFGIITACNPFSQILRDFENTDRTERLLARLETLSVPIFPISGGSQDGTHLEPGFGVEGLDLVVLRSLGREFEQDAIFWVELGSISLIPCGDGPSERGTAIQNRWIGLPQDA